MAEAKGNPAVRDAAVIAAARRGEHYEMSGYGTVRTHAERLGLANMATTLQQTLDEERTADPKLTAIAETNVNVQAQTT